ncbi:MAG: hypothetical protein ACRDKH_05690 [Solirubrobacterales bacterium]
MDKALWLLVIALAAGLIAGGCGDDDDDDGGGGEALTEQEFITQADQVCRDGDAEIEAEEQQLFGEGEPSQAEIERYATEIFVPGVQSQIDGIRELQPPEEIEGEVTEFLDTAETALDGVEEDPSAFGDEQAEDPFAEATQMASDLGLKVCAQ